MEGREGGVHPPPPPLSSLRVTSAPSLNFGSPGPTPPPGNVGIAYIGCDPPATHEVTSIWEEDMQHGLQTDAPVAHTACDFTDLTGMPQYVTA